MGEKNTLNMSEYSLKGTLLERMNITLTELSAEHATGSMPVEGNTQPMGLLHGGASVVLAETLGSIAAQMHAGEGKAAVGIEINATHHASARSGIVYGEARAIHLGRTTASYEVLITDDSGKRLCTSRITCMIISR
ncbi:PaaI family thioesterase [Timonella senegalensis]|uniref:PaaI family thioesterase n=1 Tax=Timonella senegalensis TaxID=1465825 RepID=UPI0006847E0D|nr:hotdog fold thioesterase [Timonella senegalensis]